jgi:hypothetical protein
VTEGLAPFGFALTLKVNHHVIPVFDIDGIEPHFSIAKSDLLRPAF